MILITTQTFPPAVGGMENLMRGLADAFAQSGESVCVFADAKGDAAEKIIDAECAFIVRRFGGPRILRRIRKARIIARESQNAKAVVADSWQDRGGDATADGENGILCDGKNAKEVEKAIAKILAAPPRLAEMGIAAKNRAAEFSWDIIARRHLDNSIAR